MLNLPAGWSVLRGRPRWLGLLGLALGLGAYLLWARWPKSATQSPPSGPSDPAANTPHIVLASRTPSGTAVADCLALRGEGAYGAWYSAAGERVRGERAAELSSILRTARPQRERRLTLAEDDYGLTSCRLQVVFWAAGQPPQALCFGDDAPGDLVYARVDSLVGERDPRRDTTLFAAASARACAALAARTLVPLSASQPASILLFDRALYDQLRSALSDYREGRLVPWPSQVVRRVTFVDGSQILRRDAGWFDESGAALSIEAVQALLSELGGLTLGEPAAAVSPPPTGGAAEAVAQRLLLEATSGEQIELRLWDLRLQRDGEPATVVASDNTALRRLFQRSAHALRDLRVLAWPMVTVTSLVTRQQPSADSSFALQRAERRPHGFVLTAPIAGTADGARLRELIAALGSLQAIAELPVDVGTPSPSEPQVGVQLFTGPREQSFTLSRPRPEGCRLQVTTPARALQLASADCARLWPLLTEPWLSRTLLLLDDARLRSVQVRCGEKTQTLSRRSDGFFIGERRLSADEHRERLRQLHALAEATSLRYRPAARLENSSVPARCRLQVSHTPLPQTVGGEAILAPDSAPPMQCLSVLSDGWLHPCAGGADYQLSSNGQAALASLLPKEG